MPKKPFVALLAVAVAAGTLTGASSPARAQSSYANYVDYRISAGIGTHETKCKETAKVDTPYSGTGTDGRSGSASSSFNLTEVASPYRTVASFTTQSTFRSGMVRKSDRSLRGSAAFTGKATITPKRAHLCHGIGETRASFAKVVQVPRTGTFRLSMAADDFYHLSVDVYVYPANAAGEPDEARVRTVYEFSDFWDYDTTTAALRDRKVVRVSKSLAVSKGEFVAVGFSSSVFAQSRWSSRQVQGQPIEYTYTAENGDGGTWLSYSYHPDGNQVSGTPPRVTRRVALPVNMNCGTRYFKFWPKRPGTIRRASVFVNGARVKTLHRVGKVNRVRIRKGKAITRVKIVFTYRNGATKTVKKPYYGC